MFLLLWQLLAPQKISGGGVIALKIRQSEKVIALNRNSIGHGIHGRKRKNKP